MSGFPENVTVYEPILRTTETDVNVPYYIVFTGTNSLYDIVKDLDIMLDYTGHENLLTTFSNDVSTIIGFLRTVLELNNQKIVLIGHSLGCSYVQSVLYNFCSQSPSLKDRIQKVYYFNPYILVTTEFKYIEQECLNNLGFRNKFVINIIENDYASVIFRTKPYGQVYVYPNNVEVSDNGFINQLVEDLAGSVISITRSTYLDYTNHYISNWTNEYPDERSVTALPYDITGQSIAIRTLQQGSNIKWGTITKPLNIKGYTPRVDGQLKSDVPDTDDALDDYNFLVSVPTDAIKEYFYYDFGVVKKVAFPYLISTPTYAEKVWFLNLEDIMTALGSITHYYGLMTIDQYATEHFNVITNKINTDFPSMFSETLIQSTEAYYFDSARQPAYKVRTKFLIEAPLTDAGTVRRTIEPNYMETGKYWRIKNRAFNKWLVMATGWGSYIPFAVADNSTALTSNGLTSEDHSAKYYNVTGDDEAIWNITHNDGDAFYTIKNTRYNKDMLERVLQGSTTPNNLSDYLANASPDHWTNSTIYMTHITNWDDFDFLLYVIHPTTNKKQYLTVRNAGGVNNEGTLIACSEDNFDPNSINTDSNYPAVISNNDTSIIDSNAKKYEQFVWTFHNATANIVPI